MGTQLKVRLCERKTSLVAFYAVVPLDIELFPLPYPLQSPVSHPRQFALAHTITPTLP